MVVTATFQHLNSTLLYSLILSLLQQNICQKKRIMEEQVCFGQWLRTYSITCGKTYPSRSMGTWLDYICRFHKLALLVLIKLAQGTQVSLLQDNRYHVFPLCAQNCIARLYGSSFCGFSKELHDDSQKTAIKSLPHQC